MTALGEKTTNVDIGPMQVNWKWNFHQIVSPWLITDPIYNTKLGGQILYNHYQQTNDWWVAVGKYHRASNDPSHKKAAEAYAKGDKKIWTRL